MKSNYYFKKYGAYIVAAVIFVLAALIYCFPILKGKSLYAGDVQNYFGAAKESVEYHLDTGDYTFWTGSMFSGMPNYQIGGGHYHADDLLLLLNWRIFNHRDNPILMLIMYLVCFYVMMRCFGVGKWLSIIGAFAVTLSSYFFIIIPAGHFTKVTTIAMSAVILGGFSLIFQKKYLAGATLTMVFVALGFKPHPQMFYYYFLLLGVLWIAQVWEHIKTKQYKSLMIGTAIFAASVLIGIGTGSENVFANAEYASETMRGGHSDIVAEGETESTKSKGLKVDYATQWSYGIDETMSLLIPGFMGGANNSNIGNNSGIYKTIIANGIPKEEAENFCKNAPMYWGDQPFTSGNVYIGAIICFLFLLGLLIVNGPYKWGLLIATVFSIILAWGHNCLWLTELFFKYFPMYNKFRAVSSILIVAEVAMPLLGFLALKQIMEGTVDKKRLFRSLYISGGITAGLCLLFALFGSALFSFTSQYDADWAQTIPDWLYAAVINERVHLMRSDSIRSFLYIAAAFSLLWIYSKGKLKNSWLIVLLGVLIIADMWTVDRRYFGQQDFVSKKEVGDPSFVMQDYEKALLEDHSYFRVFNMTTSPWSDARTSYYLKSIGGYSAAKLRRYQDLIDQHLNQKHWPVIGMLNAKYVIIPGADGSPVAEMNPFALGNAWFVDKIYVADNANEESDALNYISLSHEAVLDRSFAQNIPDYNLSIPEGASVVLNSYTPKELDYTYSISVPGTIVFSEIYYPYGWKATIDGEPADHYRVNYLLRAMNVPAGQHNIHFIFDPDSVKKGDVLAVICIIIMYLACVVLIGLGIYRCVRRKKNA